MRLLVLQPIASDPSPAAPPEMSDGRSDPAEAG